MFIIGKTEVIVSFPCPASRRECSFSAMDARASSLSTQPRTAGEHQTWGPSGQTLSPVSAPRPPVTESCLLMVVSAQRLMEEGHDDDSIFSVATHVLVFSARFYMVTLNFSE